MSDYVSFAVSLGLWMAIASLVAGVVFRWGNVSVLAKVAVPAALVSIGCYVPLTIHSMLGKPMVTTMAALPDHVQLLGFYPANDEETLVDLWLLSDGRPRAYEVSMTPGLKKVLEESRTPRHSGKPIMFAKGHGDRSGRPGSGNARDDDYDFDLSQIMLPPKE